MANVKHPSHLFRPNEAAHFLAISKRTLWDLTRRGIIPSIRIKRSVRYALIDLQDFIDQRRVVAAPPDEEQQPSDAGNESRGSGWNTGSDSNEN